MLLARHDDDDDTALFGGVRFGWVRHSSERPYPSADMQSMYSTAPADRAGGVGGGTWVHIDLYMRPFAANQLAVLPVLILVLVDSLGIK